MPSNKGKDEDNKSTSQRGFASMEEEKQREIASKGGHAAHEKGTAHEFSSEEAREAGRKGAHSRAKGGSEDEDKSSSSTRGGTSEQHAEAGRQSHKNR
ncbi:KGG domain-containing protein [Nitrosomonas communis]|uniref:Stress-induced acidophilic repeat motif-containing protein n=1 Tax=Nitrosomonas communis TaxID=44574 RepID=A0A1I4KD94_9PROT|nr:KGG domain-containing protein [Nitrosomonas communis]SFL76573.1 Stress-induced acidophilic repeat motif-containing protein [Nitrosomonas communis]